MNKLLLRNTFVAALSCAVVSSQAQTYPPPTVASTGIWISRAEMFNVTGITNGVNGNSTNSQGSQGYANNTLSSSGTINRGCFVIPTVTIQNCNNAGTKQYNFKLYADWNKDGDFADAGETLADINSAIQSGGTGACFSPPPISLGFTVPSITNSGDIRFRWALREGGAEATANGGWVGEIEDYLLTVTPNNAPTLNTAGTPAFNPILASQTDNPGVMVSRLIRSTEPTTVLITDAGTCEKSGIALFGTSASNGAWEYKIGTNAWTAVGARTATTALLLDANASLRFVPNAAGSANFSFRAWDQTSGSNGATVNISATGNATAFSQNSTTATIQVLATATADNDLTAYMTAYDSTAYARNIISSLVGSPTKQFDQVTTGNIGNGRDIVLDQLNSNLYWIGGDANASVMRSGTDGSNPTQLVVPEGLTNPSGLTLAENLVYVIDNIGIWVYENNGAFNNYLPLPGPGFEGGRTGDIEYASGKLYFTYQDAFVGSHSLYSMNTDGSGVTNLYTFPSIPKGLDIANGNIYWTEQNGATPALRFRAISGGAVTTLATGTNRQWLDLIVNTANSRIYFADMNLTNGDGYVKSVPRTGGTVAKELLLDAPVTSLALFRDPATLPVHFVSINAWVQDSRNMVEWTVAQELNVKSYIIERSSNGRDYSEIGTVAAISQPTYQFPDAAPLTGVNIYRIKSLDFDGNVLYSPIVRLVRDDQSKGVAVYPTLVTNNQFNLRLQNLRSGSYQLQVINSLGQPVLTQRLNHNTGVTSSSINLPGSTAKGVYRVVVIGDNDKYTTNIVVQ